MKMAQRLIDVNAIKEHLSKRPIAPIFDKSTEKDDFDALKLMCIVDFHAEQKDLYQRIRESSNPKLLSQLFQFHCFGTFRYFDYVVDHKMELLTLKCKFCELTGSYACILTHMAINHNSHFGLKMCVFCNKKELKKHFDEHDFAACYGTYRDRNYISDDKKEWHIVSHFYDMLKSIAKTLKITTARKSFVGHSYAVLESLDRSYGDDFPDKCLTFHLKTRKYNKPIASEALEKEFKRVTDILFGNTIHFTRVDRGNDDVIVIDSDDEAETNNTRNSATHSAHTKCGSEFASNRTTNENDGSSNANTLFKSEPKTNEESTSADSSETIVYKTGSKADASSSSANTSAHINWSELNETEKFGLAVAQCLNKLPEGRKRRKLECDIQEVMLKATREEFD